MHLVCSSEKKTDSEASNGVSINLAVPDSGWKVACTTVEEWNEVIESLEGSKHAETKRLLRTLQGVF